MKVTDQSCLIQSLHPELICSSTFWEHPYAEEIHMKVLRALPYFPEITFPLTLNRHGTRGSYNAIAYVNFKTEPGVNFNIHFRPSMNTVFHELGHILQHFTDFDIPYGEEAASIYTLSRMPDSFIDSENIPYIGLAPRCMIGDYCRQALEYKKTHRNYIKWLRAQLLADYEDGVWPKCDTFISRITSEQSKKHYEQLTV